eukprot:5190373-Amphidinium_carterae.2
MPSEAACTGRQASKMIPGQRESIRESSSGAVRYQCLRVGSHWSRQLGSPVASNRVSKVWLSTLLVFGAGSCRAKFRCEEPTTQHVTDHGASMNTTQWSVCKLQRVRGDDAP